MEHAFLCMCFTKSNEYIMDACIYTLCRVVVGVGGLARLENLVHTWNVFFAI